MISSLTNVPRSLLPKDIGLGMDMSEIRDTKKSEIFGIHSWVSEHVKNFVFNELA